MSYDLFVFIPSTVPENRDNFLDWFDVLEWEDIPKCFDPSTCHEKIKAFFFDMTKKFPAMNGPFSTDTTDEIPIADYTIGSNYIYLTFTGLNPKRHMKQLLITPPININLDSSM